MNRYGITRNSVIAFLLAAFFVTAGMFLIVHVFQSFEWAVLHHNSHEELMDAFHLYSFRLLMGMGMVCLGLAIGSVLFLHLVRRTARIEREATALHRKNEKMQALNAQIRQLNHHQRLEIIGTLTSSIAHEFNNLLTPIMGYSLMALEKLPPEEEELYDNLLEVYNASKEAKNIISRLNDLSRKQSETSFRYVSLDDIVSHTMKVAGPAKPKPVVIQQKLNCWGQRIRANEIQLSQLVLNLVLNAFHAMENGGILTVETSFDESWAYLRISDTGCGISEENKPKIFEPFFTTKETGKGTGLGLAIAAQTVEDHNGQIQVESTLGKGTVFTVLLPRK